MGVTAATHPDLAWTYFERVTRLRKGEGSIPEFLKEVSSKKVFAAPSNEAASRAEKAAKGPPKLVIVKATYGDLPAGPSVDVTDKVKALVTAQGLTVAATSNLFGAPADGIVKKLKVEYTLDREKYEKTVGGGETLTISLAPAKLVIVRAVYGDYPYGGWNDVTVKVRALVNDGALSVLATNDKFGDPAPGVVKKLKVEYTFEGARESKEVAENETLTISNKGE
jgi:hypothetical protein